MSDLVNHSVAVTKLCTDDQVVALTKYGKVEAVLVSVDFFNELVERANDAETYQSMWQAEVNSRKGNMLSAKEALEALEKLREAREGNHNGNDAARRAAL